MEYTQADMEAMKRDALRRTREMHSNARKNVHTGNTVNVQPTAVSEVSQNTHSRISSSEPEKQEKSSNSQTKPFNNLLSGIFSGGKIDEDKIIIIMLIIILARNGADLKLLIALGYILI